MNIKFPPVLERSYALAALFAIAGFGSACGDGSNGSFSSRGFSLGQADGGDLEHRQNAVREYFAARLAELDIVATTQTDSGAIIDWVPYTQPLETPPPMPQLPPLEAGEEWARGELADQPWARGPDGTSPRMRFDVEGYLRWAGDAVPDDPRLVLKHAAPAPDSNNRYYNRHRLTHPICQGQGGSACGNWGGAVNIELWNSDLESGDTNIAQIAIARGSGSDQQTVEAGKIEASFNGGAPTFFTYFTTDGYDPNSTGNWTGRYNDGVEFEQWGSPTLLPGMAFSSTSSASTRVFLYVAVIHGSPGNAWWIFANGEWIGYYIECHDPSTDDETSCSTPGAARTFDSAGMGFFASRMSVYGEVYDSNAPVDPDGSGPLPPVVPATTTDMGRGTAQGARMKSITVNLLSSQSGVDWTGTNPATSSYGTLSTGETDSNCYDLGALGYSTTLGNNFLYGGDGAEATGCD